MNRFGHVYEYFMDCDNVRLIYWQTGPGGHGRIVDFMIEPLEEESLFVVRKKQHLKKTKRCIAGVCDDPISNGPVHKAMIASEHG